MQFSSAVKVVTPAVFLSVLLSACGSSSSEDLSVINNILEQDNVLVAEEIVKEIANNTESIIVTPPLESNGEVDFSNVQIEWLDNSDNEDAFIVVRKNIRHTHFDQVEVLPKDTISYTDTGVIVGESYCYKVVAVNAGGQANSEESCLEVTY
ncbi:hypothetical protein CW745_08775 [Psychromonas sp. psych-6C06]|uniref:hypothetical protein n=1 Tax=Psychromonas sp. psych-6C06 TaxID=2058089 RepID=UPI000C323CE4|nr:hypothetical protein [Psychromonas sp. psych-6C06]PKF61421.1 hypothetical protein CW745_08775 [Psychromonas sp. psych-6C06]